MYTDISHLIAFLYLFDRFIVNNEYNISMNTTETPMKYVKKGWGYELIICNSEEYCGKLLYMEKGKHLSYHFHRLKDEHFYLNRGRVRLVYGDTDDISEAVEKILEPGQNFHVYRGLRHRLYALENSEIFEFSTHSEDTDSIRIIPGDQ
jgi:quercetin dioxygenase-like cupin family protein